MDQLTSAFSSGYQADRIAFNNCEFQVTNAPLLVEATCTSVSFDVSNPVFHGGLPFIYLPYLEPAYIKRISIFGGRVGTNVKPIDLPGNAYSPNITRINIPNVYLTEKHELSVQSAKTTKTYYIAHGLSSTPNYINVASGSEDIGNTRILKVEREATNIIITLASFPIVGTNNLIFYYEAKAYNHYQ
ncbi:hypothetical protein [Paenibacillus sp. NPDC101420]|uniref:hypothetical protein n=1 Tax=Paenibacillus sp. NPDC101420 TaxID=3390602 RepID=UPI003D07317C